MNCTRRSFLQGSLATLFVGGLNLPLFASSVKKTLSIFLDGFLRASKTACFPTIKKVVFFMFLKAYYSIY